MIKPLIATKLHVPRTRANVVARRGLLDRLGRGASSKLTLVSAPAGFGKTTLLAIHAAAKTDRDHAAAWLSLDASDNEPAAFWRHLIASLRVVEPEVGVVVHQLAEEAQDPGEPALAALVNELGDIGRAIEVVFDDYHVIDRAEIHAGMTYLLEHLPPNVHLVIGTRADPPLPLARLRARGELTEVRAADLRFSAEEAATYLHQVAGLALDKQQIATLTGKTEGWIAALQLAAISIGGSDDVGGFLASFAGTDRYVFDYLLEEVLDRQPEDVRQFLRKTCFLDRLSGSLCDAVTDGTGSGAMLNRLERSNLFVVPLDANRQWFRYHHLFADVLQTLFGEQLRDELPALHRRASQWHAARGEDAEAIDHALAGSDTESAAHLIERSIPAMRRSRREAGLRRWIEALPDEHVRQSPVLQLGLVGALMSVGSFDGVEQRLQQADDRLRAGTARVADPDQLPGLPAAVELYRAALAQVRGDTPAVMEHAGRCLDLAPENDHLVRGGASGFLGIARWSSGALEAAETAWRDSRTSLLRAGHIADVFGTSIALADINATLGRLRAAARVHEEALELAAQEGNAAMRGTADAHAGLSELHRLSGDFDLAGQHLARSQELGELAGLPQFPCRWRVAMAQLRDAAGDPEAALDLLDEAERVYVPDFFPDVRPIGAMKARILIRQGRLAEAERWRSEAGIAVGDALSYLREFEHITLARLLLASGVRTEALALLERLQEAAQVGGRIGSLIEILVLKALAQSGEARDVARASLERALALAGPEGFVQVFLDEGQPMAALLKGVAKQGSGHARTLLALFGTADTRQHPDLVESLSERERDVLRLLQTDLDGPEIARELGVSLNTMRTHTKNIYDKLGVGSRRAAVRRAEELELL